MYCVCTMYYSVHTAVYTGILCMYCVHAQGVSCTGKGGGGVEG